MASVEKKTASFDKTCSGPNNATTAASGTIQIASQIPSVASVCVTGTGADMARAAASASVAVARKYPKTAAARTINGNGKPNRNIAANDSAAIMYAV